MSKKILFLDCGHGVNVGGKRCSKKLDPNETREWTLSNRIALLVEMLCKRSGWEVVRTDDRTGATNVSPQDRVRVANNIIKVNPNCKTYFISIHEDANPTGSTSGSGISVFHSSSLEVRETQAKELYNFLIAHTGLVGNRSNPVRNQNLYVTKYTKCPSFLCELGFMDNAHDVPIILSQDFANRSAQAIADFVNTR
jgi:N-acetylmuramoyl-L-alanine amidase